MKRKSLSNTNGFTLVEVMIALAVLSIGIVGMMLMQGSGIRGNSTANTVTTGATLVGDRIEQIFAMDYDDLSDGDNDGTGGLDDVSAATADGNDTSDPDYDVFWNVVEDMPMPYTKFIRVIVTRVERGQTRAISYNYVKAGIIDN